MTEADLRQVLETHQARLDFDEASHRYRLDGREVPGVTRALKVVNLYPPGVDPVAMAAKAELGKAVHHMIHLDGLGVLDTDALDDQLRPYLRGWRRFLATSGLVILAQELFVASPRYAYAGQLDILGLLHRRLALIDAKAVASLMRTTGPQTAGYENAVREWRPDLVPAGAPVDRFALQLTPDGGHSLAPYKNPRDLRTFLAALECHNFIQGK